MIIMTLWNRDAAGSDVLEGPTTCTTQKEINFLAFAFRFLMALLGLRA